MFRIERGEARWSQESMEMLGIISAHAGQRFFFVLPTSLRIFV